MSHYDFQKLLYSFLSEDFFSFSNNVDPDEMQHYAAFHCLQKYSFRGFPEYKGLKSYSRDQAREGKGPNSRPRAEILL